MRQYPFSERKCPEKIVFSQKHVSLSILAKIILKTGNSSNFLGTGLFENKPGSRLVLNWQKAMHFSGSEYMPLLIQDC